MSTAKRYLMLLIVALSARSAYVGCAIVYNGDQGLRYIFPDTATYVWPALSLVELGEFRTRPGSRWPPMVFRLPGYPAFLAAHYAFFGFHQIPVLITQGLVGAGTVLVGYALLSRWLSDQRLAQRTGDLLCIAPTSVVASAMVMSDLLSYATFAAGLWVFTEGMYRGRRRLLLLAGAIWGASVFVHPRVLLFVAAIPLLGYVAARRFGRRVPWLSLAGVVAVFCVFPLSWSLRNYRCVGIFNVSDGGSILLRYQVGSHALAHSDWEQAKALRAQWRAADRQLRDKGWTAVQIDKKRSEEAWQVIRSHPFLVAKAYVYSVLRTLASTADYTLYLLPPPPRLRRFAQMSLAWMTRAGVLIAAAGFFLVWRRDRWAAAFLLLLVAYFVGVAAIGMSQGARSVLNAEPAYLAFFVAGLLAIGDALRRLVGGTPRRGCRRGGNPHAH